MRDDQIEKTIIIKDMIRSKGLIMSFVAEKVGMSKFTLSRMLSGKETGVRDKVIDRLYSYISQVNTNDIEV